jgi:hypothetical protein
MVIFVTVVIYTNKIKLIFLKNIFKMSYHQVGNDERREKKFKELVCCFFVLLYFANFYFSSHMNIVNIGVCVRLLLFLIIKIFKLV